MSMLDTMSDIIRLQAARTAHEVNRAYCAMNGDLSHKPWDETPPEIQASTLSGVNKIFAGELSTPQDSFESWKAYKVAEGWTYGPVKDLELKTHPNIVPYDQLSEYERGKDVMFFAVVLSFASE